MAKSQRLFQSNLHFSEAKRYVGRAAEYGAAKMQAEANLLEEKKRIEKCAVEQGEERNGTVTDGLQRA